MKKILYLFSMLPFCGGTVGSAADFPSIYNSEKSIEGFVSPEEALRRIDLPSGFKATLFAAEPDISQPISMTFDERGRLWLAANYTYAENKLNFDMQLRDRILILEDIDQDGHMDNRVVFWEEGVKLSSIEVGFGGIWVLAPPNLMFIPDRDRDDIPDSKPEILLDGFEGDRVRHNLANGLKWGPDGWLYGRHGILAKSYVGKPGDPASARTMMDCAIWRYHPQRKIFEVVVRGTTNSWGHDWNELGELFFTNTVIGHLWHAVPGANFKRMFGEHANPHLYQYMSQTADHYHWNTREAWNDIRQEVTESTLDLGGGHAHSGFMIYQGDNWPQEYRDVSFTLSFHGRRINQDILKRDGAGYTGYHAPDLIQFGDPWFRGVELLYGPQGKVWIADWSDTGECHENDGVHRTSGRLYQISYDPGNLNPSAPSPEIEFNLGNESNEALVHLQLHQNEWYVRQARRLLVERYISGQDLSAAIVRLKEIFEGDPDVTRKLRALWCLHGIEALTEDWKVKQLSHRHESIRAWIVRLLVDQEIPSSNAIEVLAGLSMKEESGLVRLYLASALQRLPFKDRWSLLPGLAGDSRYLEDRSLPLMIWYGLEPAVIEDPRQAVQLFKTTPFTLLQRFIARRMASEIGVDSQPISLLLQELNKDPEPELLKTSLQGIKDALKGSMGLIAPEPWKMTYELSASLSDPFILSLANEISWMFGDQQAEGNLLSQVKDPAEPKAERITALSNLSRFPKSEWIEVFQHYALQSDFSPPAVKGLSGLNNSEVDSWLIRQYASLPSDGRETVLDVLSQRRRSAISLLSAVEDGEINPDALSVPVIRQMRNLSSDRVDELLDRIWPGRLLVSKDKELLLARYMGQLTDRSVMNSARLTEGRELFQKLCANCHKLNGIGKSIGPDLTGSDRRNLSYLLENLLDPSAIVPEDYQLSIVRMSDGRVITGVILRRNAHRITIQTMTESLILSPREMDSVTSSKLSLMPEGLLESLEANQVRDLIAFLMAD